MKKIITMLFIVTTTLNALSQSAEKKIQLNEIEVNADKTNVYKGVGRIVTVINQTEIEKAPVKSIDELLDYIAGIDVRQRGVNGVQADVSIRGGSFDQILILLNGINITDPQTGHYNLDIPLDLADVSRIEILQGSAARVLGPNAFSGAINIITGERKPEEKPDSTKFISERGIWSGINQKRLSEENEYILKSHHSTGSYGYLSQSVSANYFNKKWSVLGSAINKKSNGYIENTDFNTSNFYLQSKYNSLKTGTIEAQAAVQIKSFGSNSFYSLAYPNQFEHTRTFLTTLNWNYLVGNTTVNTQVYWRQHHDRFELFRNMEGAEQYSWYTGHNYHLTNIMGGKITGSYTGFAGKTTLGADIRNEQIYSNVLGVKMEEPYSVPFEKNQKFTFEDSRLISNIFLDHSLKARKWTLSGGVALNHVRQFGTHINGGCDIVYEFTKKARIYASANSAVRLPTFTDLYYKGPQQAANPDLQPEKSTTFELGTKISTTRLFVSGTAYYRFGRNVIDWVKRDTTDIKYVSLNLTNVNAIGTDISTEYRLSKGFLHSITFNYSFLNLYKHVDMLESKYALDYLKHKVVIGLNHTVCPRLKARWNFGYYDRSGSYPDFVTKQKVDYKPYVMADVRFNWQGSAFNLYGDINNLLNQKQVDFGGLSLPGRNFLIGIKLQII
ncbi:MAG: TonB-dependent receptor [Bacteroidetes bacterium]|nr:TonB-dependent receptor [Bacteroidota bacterium]